MALGEISPHLLSQDTGSVMWVLALPYATENTFVFNLLFVLLLEIYVQFLPEETQTVNERKSLSGLGYQ